MLMYGKLLEVCAMARPAPKHRSTASQRENVVVFMVFFPFAEDAQLSAYFYSNQAKNDGLQCAFGCTVSTLNRKNRACFIAGGGDNAVARLLPRAHLTSPLHRG